ncbi:Interleukin-17F, partial [Acipenser ruthenus]
FRLNEDETRIPRVIPEAVCKFKWCVNSIGDKDQKLNSVEIQQEMYVLKLKLNATGGGKGCRQDIYTVETMMITVGCTCVNPIIMES